MSNKQTIFIFCKDYSEFLQYTREFPPGEGKQYEFITDINTLRGRPPSKVVTHGHPEERWDYIGLLDAIEIEKKVWEGMIKDKKEEPDKDLEYGFGEQGK